MHDINTVRIKKVRGCFYALYASYDVYGADWVNTATSSNSFHFPFEMCPTVMLSRCAAAHRHSGFSLFTSPTDQPPVPSTVWDF